MRSRFEQAARMLTCAIAVALLSLAPMAVPATASAGAATVPSAASAGSSAGTLTAADASHPGEPVVEAAMRKLRHDPNLMSTASIHTLRWVSSSDEPSAADPSWLRWIVNLFAWLAESGRLIVWILCAVVVGVLAVYLLRLLRGVRRGEAEVDVVAPTHVRDLDIRPESLPEDIGAAARELWNQAEHRAALALLYRGALSRLAHVHAVPIRHSTTEGECVGLAARHLSASGAHYVAQLVRIWQRAVYRGEEPATEPVMMLCDGFAAALSAPPAPSPEALPA